MCWPSTRYNDRYTLHIGGDPRKNSESRQGSKFMGSWGRSWPLSSLHSIVRSISEAVGAEGCAVTVHLQCYRIIKLTVVDPLMGNFQGCRGDSVRCLGIWFIRFIVFFQKRKNCKKFLPTSRTTGRCSYYDMTYTLHSPDNQRCCDQCGYPLPHIPMLCDQEPGILCPHNHRWKHQSVVKDPTKCPWDLHTRCHPFLLPQGWSISVHMAEFWFNRLTIACNLSPTVRHLLINKAHKWGRDPLTTGKPRWLIHCLQLDPSIWLDYKSHHRKDKVLIGLDKTCLQFARVEGISRLTGLLSV